MLVGTQSPLVFDAPHFNRNPRSAYIAPMTFGDAEAFTRTAVVADEHGCFYFLLCPHSF